jgi:hypothetical protein
MRMRPAIGSCSFAMDSTGTPAAVPGPSCAMSELTVTVTVDDVSMTLVTRVQAPPPVTVPRWIVLRVDQPVVVNPGGAIQASRPCNRDENDDGHHEDRSSGRTTPSLHDRRYSRGSGKVPCAHRAQAWGRVALTRRSAARYPPVMAYEDSVERLLRPLRNWLAIGGDAERMDLEYWSTRRDLMVSGETFSGVGAEHLGDIDVAMDAFDPAGVANPHFAIDERQLRRELTEALDALRDLGVISATPRSATASRRDVPDVD